MSHSFSSSLHILITNNTLGGRAGSEIYARDLAIELMKRGHHPVVFSTTLGEVAEDLRKATVPVIDDLHSLSVPPDIIHGQHHLETMMAALHFPLTPVVSICHGWLPWEEAPPLFPSIIRHVAVDDLCKERLLTTRGILAENVEVFYNFVDMERFQLRSPLPSSPRSALVFSNYSTGATVDVLQSACRKFGIAKVDVAGASMGNVLVSPEKVLGNYDVVFAKAKCALEAIASGCALIVADFAGLGGMVTTENVESLRRLNFGVRTMQRASISEETVLRELQLYNADDARRVSLLIREKASMSSAIDRWEQFYRQVLTDWSTRIPGDSVALADDHMQAAAEYLRKLAPRLKTQYDAIVRADHVERILAEVKASNVLIEARVLTAENLANEAENRARVQAENALQLEGELQQIHTSRAWRLVTLYRILKYQFLHWIRRGGNP